MDLLAVYSAYGSVLKFSRIKQITTQPTCQNLKLTLRSYGVIIRK